VRVDQGVRQRAWMPAHDNSAVRDVLARSGEGSALDVHMMVRDAIQAVAAAPF
jgi:hypothetical protein